jgi:hypothetical protein
VYEVTESETSLICRMVNKDIDNATSPTAAIADLGIAEDMSMT